MRFAAIVFVLATALGALAQAENPQIRKEIQAVYAQWDKYVAAKNIEGLMSMLDKSFVGMDEEGNAATYAEVRQHMKSMAGSIADIKSKITVDHVYVQGDEVVAWVTMKLDMKFKGSNATETFTGKFAETLKKFDGKWKFVSSQGFPG